MVNSSSPNGNFYPQDFDLESVDIITDSGEVYKLKYLVTELSFFEDIFSFACSGNVILRDAVGIIEKLQLNGSEFIQITYGKYKSQDESSKNKRRYKLYKVGNRKPSGNKASEFFTLYFCSEELLLSEQLKISKSYKGQAVSDIVFNLLKDDENGLKVNVMKIQNIEQTYGTYDFVVPRLKPFEAISWLSGYARPSEDTGADMLFFETNDGYYFRSLQSMFSDDTYATYKYQPSNIGNMDNRMNILEYEFIKTYDSLDATSSGINASRLITIDPLNRTQTVTDFNKDKLEGYSNSGSSVNRFNKKSTEMYDGSFRLAFGNSNQVDDPYIKQSQGDVAKDIFVETYVPNRSAQIALSNYTVMKAIIPGDSGITAGRTVEILLYSLQVDGDNKNQTRAKDEYFSGKYLVTAVRHIIQTQGVFQTVLELAKESLKSNYNSSTTTYE
jgi:hypothetical protein